MKILLALVMVLAMLALTPVPAFAQATATRTLPDAAVAPSAQFEVGIDADGFGAFGQVVETLPTDFTYVTGSATAVSGIAEDTVAEAVDGQNVTFTFLCESPISFTYNVTAPDTAGGPFYFAGVLNGATADVDPIGGDTEVNVGEAEGATATRTLPDAGGSLAKAAFATSNLSISPSEIDIGETVTISLTVTNTGNAAGSYEVTLKINGVVEATKEVTLNAGASKEVTFTAAKDVAASYSVDVNGLSGSFSIREKPAPPAPPPEEAPPEVPPAEVINWPVIGGIIAGVIVVGLLIFFLARRRAA